MIARQSDIDREYARLLRGVWSPPSRRQRLAAWLRRPRYSLAWVVAYGVTLGGFGAWLS